MMHQSLHQFAAAGQTVLSEMSTSTRQGVTKAWVTKNPAAPLKNKI
jgi:hypothetical protein